MNGINRLLYVTARNDALIDIWCDSQKISLSLSSLDLPILKSLSPSHSLSLSLSPSAIFHAPNPIAIRIQLLQKRSGAWRRENLPFHNTLVWFSFCTALFLLVSHFPFLLISQWVHVTPRTSRPPRSRPWPRSRKKRPRERQPNRLSGLPKSLTRRANSSMVSRCVFLHHCFFFYIGHFVHTFRFFYFLFWYRSCLWSPTTVPFTPSYLCSVCFMYRPHEPSLSLSCFIFFSH